MTPQEHRDRHEILHDRVVAAAVGALAGSLFVAALLVALGLGRFVPACAAVGCAGFVSLLVTERIAAMLAG